MKDIIVASCWPRQSSLLRKNQTEKIYRTARANISTVMNEGANMCFKAVTSNLFKVVGLFFKPSTYIVKPKGYLETYISIMQPPIAVTSRSPVIPPSLPPYLLIFHQYAEIQ